MGNSLLQFALFAAVTIALALPCATYLARVFTQEAPCFLGFIERIITALAGSQIERQQNWWGYATSVLAFNALGAVLLFLIVYFIYLMRRRLRD